MRLYLVFYVVLLTLNHLEHCLECILSVIEFIQFKQRIFGAIKAAKGDQLTEDEVDEFREMEAEMERYVVLPPNCPQSAIVHSDHDCYKKMARDLYIKYIRTESEFEINLRYGDRKRYSKLMENATSWLKERKHDSNMKLFELFDVCITEMCGLLIAAFSRYKQSNEYIVLRKYDDL